MSAWHSPRVRAWDGASVALPQTEANSLYQLLRAGETPDTIRALIRVSDSDKAHLLKIKPQSQVLETIEYRQQVLHHFDSLVNSNAPIAILECIPRRKRRRVARGRRGSGQPRKLSTDDVCRIKKFIESGSMTRAEASRRFSVSGTTIGRLMEAQA